MSLNSDEAPQSVHDSVSELNAALRELDKQVEILIERQQQVVHSDEEIQRLASNSAKLAKELDDAQTRANRLAQTNGEVSRRLVGAMEMIRTVLDR